MRASRKRFVLVPTFLLLMTISSHAQWVAVARAVSGRIQRMEQQGANGQGGYDVATVVIEANAKNVYDTFLQRVKGHAGAL